MSIGMPTGDPKSLLSGFSSAGADKTCSSSDSWQDLGAMLVRAGKEGGGMESALCPRCGHPMRLSLCVREDQTALASSL